MLTIGGIAGVGKSAVAVEYVWSRQTKYDAVFWVDARSSAHIETAYKRIAFALGLVSPDSIDHLDPVLSREKVKGWLENPLHTVISGGVPKSAKWLLVFDGADEEPEFDLWDFLPLFGSGCILITTRNLYLRLDSGHETRRVTLGPLERPDAAELLQDMASLQAVTLQSGEACLNICCAVECLSFPILKISEYISRKDLSFEEFWDLWQEEEWREEIYRYEGIRTRGDSRMSLTMLFGLDEFGLAASSMLSMMVFLDPSAMPEKLFQMMNGEVEASLKLPKTKLAYVEARYELSRTSIVRRDREKQLLSISRLVRDIMRTELRKAGSFIKIFIATTRQLHYFLSADFKSPSEDIELQNVTLEGLEELMPHLKNLKHEFGLLKEEQKQEALTIEMGRILEIVPR